MRVFKEVTETRGLDVDALVNNAAIIGGVGDFHDNYDDAHVRRHVGVNCTAYAQMINAFGRPMKERGTGHILNVSSIAGIGVWSQKVTTYFASKAFVTNFSKGVGQCMRVHGVSVTCSNPGFFHSEMTQGLRWKDMWASPLYFIAVPLDSTKRVAVDSYNALFNGDEWTVPGITGPISWTVFAHMPRVVWNFADWLLWSYTNGPGHMSQSDHEKYVEAGGTAKNVEAKS